MNIFFESLRNHICILCLEKNQISRRIHRLILLHRIINVILSGDILKQTDILILDFNVGRTLPLADQFFHCHLAMGWITLLCLCPVLAVHLLCFPMCQIRHDRLLHGIPRKSSCLDSQGNCLLIDFFLQIDSSSPKMQ